MLRVGLLLMQLLILDLLILEQQLTLLLLLLHTCLQHSGIESWRHLPLSLG